MKRLSLPSVGLLEAVRDPQLLGAGLTLWPMQERLLEGVAEHRLNIWALGRRSGKSTTAALALLWCCLLRPELLERLRPGERGVAMIVATNSRQARLILNAARSLVERSPLLSEMIDSVTEDELTFVNQTSIFAAPCSSRAGRGWPLIALAIDECAHLATESEGFQAASRVWEALVPGTAQFADLARIIVASTPFGSDGLFPDLFQRASAGELGNAVCFQASTLDSNPTIPAQFLEAERARDPDSFRGEFEAEFIGSGSAYLDPSRVDAAVAARGELDPSMCRRWIAGLDPAFSSDPFGLALVGQDLFGSGRLQLGVVRSWKPTKGAGTFEERRDHEDRVLGEVAAVIRQYTTRCVTDQYAAPAVVDRLRREGLSIEAIPMTPGSKTAAYAEVRSRINLGTLELYDHPALIGELKRLRSKYTAGAAQVINPRVGGSHGDMAQAVALAVYEHDRWGIARGASRERANERDVGAIARLDELERLIPVSGHRSRRWYDRGRQVF